MFSYPLVLGAQARSGSELHGLRFTLEAALERARDVAAVHRKPAWLLDEAGCPLQPIQRDALH